MKIIIAGAGQIGSHIAKMYSTDESNEITLMDIDDDSLNYASRTCDINTIVASCTSLYDLRKIGIASADLFIAVTNTEEANILGCQIAKFLGAKHVIARVNNTEYVNDKNIDIMKHWNIESFVSPEALAAKEIASHLKFSRCKILQEFDNNDLKICSIKIITGSKIIGESVEDVHELFAQYQSKILGIKRKTQTIMAKKWNRVQESDLLFVLTKEAFLQDIQNICNNSGFISRNIIILGGGRIASLVAKQLQRSMNVKIIEKSKTRCNKLADNLEQTLIINGDGTDLEFLRENNIEKTDVFIAVTENSETNILTSLLVSKEGVKETIAEVENIDFIELASYFGVGMLVNKKMISVNHIYRYTCLSSLINSDLITGVDTSILVFNVAKNAQITKNKLVKISIPETVDIAVVIRDGKPVEINKDTRVQENDNVVVFASIDSMVVINRLF